MTSLRGFILFLGIAFIAACIWAGTSGHLIAEFGEISTLPWGKISLADLYLGFFLISVIIFIFEPVRISLPVIALLFVFGNWVAAFWLAARLPKIIRTLRGTA